MYFKMYGLRYNNPTGTPSFNDKEYLASLQFARAGDIVIDELGSQITFGVVAVHYAVPPVGCTETMD